MKLYKDADGVLWIGNETVDAGHIRARINGNILSIVRASDDTTIFSGLATDYTREDGSVYDTIPNIIKANVDFFVNAPSSGGATILKTHVFASDQDRDNYFAGNPVGTNAHIAELKPGTNVISGGNMLAWTAQTPATPSAYSSASWTGSTTPLTAPQIKTLYESNANTNALTDSKKQLLDFLSFNPTLDRIVSQKSLEVPANTVYIGEDTGISSGLLALNVSTPSINRRALLLSEIYDDTGHLEAPIFAISPIQTIVYSTLESEISDTDTEMVTSSYPLELVRRVHLKVNTPSVQVRVQATIRKDGAAGAILYKLDESILSDADGNLIFDMATPIMVTDQMNMHLELTCQGMKGATVNGKFKPFMKFEVQKVEPKEIAKKEEVDELTKTINSIVPDNAFLSKAKSLGLAENSLEDVDLNKLNEKIGATDAGKQIGLNTNEISKLKQEVSNIAASNGYSLLHLETQSPIVDWNQYSNDKFIDYVLQFTSDNQVIEIKLPKEDDSIQVIVSTLIHNFKNCILKILPNDGKQINGSNSNIEVINYNGIAGLAIPLSDASGYKWISYNNQSHSSGITVNTDINNYPGIETIVLGQGFDITNDPNGKTEIAINSVTVWENMNGVGGGATSFVKVEEPLQAFIDPQNPVGQPARMKLRIKHGTYEEKIPEGYYAKLGQREEIIGLQNGQRAHVGKVWCNTKIVPEYSYITLDEAEKAIGIQETDEQDPNVTGGTPFLVGFYVDLEGKAPSDGYIELYLKELGSDSYVKTINGDDFCIRKYFKKNKELGKMLLIDVVIAKEQKYLTIDVEHSFTSPIYLTENTGVMLQSYSAEYKTGLAQLAFLQDIDFKFETTHRFLSTDIGSMAWEFTQGSPSKVYLAEKAISFSNNIHIYNTTDVNITLDSGILDVPNQKSEFNVGSILDYRTTKYLLNQDLIATINMSNPNWGFTIGFFGWTLEPDKYDSRIIVDYMNGNEILADGWIKLSDAKIIPTSSTADFNTQVGDFLIPADQGINNVAVLLYTTGGGSSPVNLSIKSFDISIANPINIVEITNVITDDEYQLKLSPQYAQSKLDLGMYSFNTNAIEVDINHLPQALPTGTIRSGKAAIVANYDPSGKGNLFNYSGCFNILKDMTIKEAYAEISLSKASGAGSSEGTNFYFMYLKRGKQFKFPLVLDDYVKIDGSDMTVIVDGTFKSPQIITTPKWSFEAKEGDVIILVAVTSNDKGTMIISRNATQPMITYHFNTIEESFERIKARVAGGLDERHLVIYSATLQKNKYVQLGTSQTMIPYGSFIDGDGTFEVDFVQSGIDTNYGGIKIKDDAIVNIYYQLKICKEVGDTSISLWFSKKNIDGSFSEIPGTRTSQAITVAIGTGNWQAVSNAVSFAVNDGDEIYMFGVSATGDNKAEIVDIQATKGDWSTKFSVVIDTQNVSEKLALSKLMENFNELVISDAAKSANWYISLDIDSTGKPSLTPKQRV